MSDVKYYQNELTNVEIKSITLQSALSTKNEQTIKMVIKELIETERNIILKKGESTVSLEKEKIDDKNTTALLDSLKSLVKATKGS